MSKITSTFQESYAINYNPGKPDQLCITWSDLFVYPIGTKWTRYTDEEDGGFIRHCWTVDVHIMMTTHVIHTLFKYNEKGEFVDSIEEHQEYHHVTDPNVRLVFPSESKTELHIPKELMKELAEENE
jgi:hypothetical protein